MGRQGGSPKPWGWNDTAWLAGFVAVGAYLSWSFGQLVVYLVKG
jgi:hypothetical protein